MGFFGLKAGEKAVEGGFDCLKHWIGGNNAVKLQQAKTQHDLAVGGLIIGGGALLLYGAYRIVESAADKIVNNGGKVEAEVGWGKAHAKINIEGGKN